MIYESDSRYVVYLSYIWVSPICTHIPDSKDQLNKGPCFLESYALQKRLRAPCLIGVFPRVFSKIKFYSPNHNLWYLYSSTNAYLHILGYVIVQIRYQCPRGVPMHLLIVIVLMPVPLYNPRK